MARTQKAEGIKIPWSVVIAVSICLSAMDPVATRQFMAELAHALVGAGTTP